MPPPAAGLLHMPGIAQVTHMDPNNRGTTLIGHASR